MNPVLLLVDDDEAIRTQMKWALSANYEIVSAEDRGGAVETFKKKKPVVTLLDLGLPPRPNDPDEGLAALAELKALDDMAKVIVISGQGEKKNAMEAVAAGAYDFLCKPIDPDELKLLLKRCIYLADLEREYRKAKESQHAPAFEDMLGTSSQMQGVFSFIRKVATSTAPVLLLGESGTGKEMAAVAIHNRGPRKDGPFVPINCNAIPENLLESELFGHEKGSFTGATMQRMGLVETAKGGTLFLDEIGELPLDLQPRLLRAPAETQPLANQLEPDRGHQQRQLPVHLTAAQHLPDTRRQAGDDERREVPDRFLGTELAQAAAGKPAADRERQGDELAVGERGEADHHPNDGPGVGSGDEASQKRPFERQIGRFVVQEQARHHARCEGQTERQHESEPVRPVAAFKNQDVPKPPVADQHGRERGHGRELDDQGREQHLLGGKRV